MSYIKTAITLSSILTVATSVTLVDELNNSISNTIVTFSLSLFNSLINIYIFIYILLLGLPIYKSSAPLEYDNISNSQLQDLIYFCIYLYRILLVNFIIDNIVWILISNTFYMDGSYWYLFSFILTNNVIRIYLIYSVNIIRNSLYNFKLKRMKLVMKTKIFIDQIYTINFKMLCLIIAIYIISIVLLMGQLYSPDYFNIHYLDRIVWVTPVMIVLFLDWYVVLHRESYFRINQSLWESVMNYIPSFYINKDDNNNNNAVIHLNNTTKNGRHKRLKKTPLTPLVKKLPNKSLSDRSSFDPPSALNVWYSYVCTIIIIVVFTSTLQNTWNDNTQFFLCINIVLLCITGILLLQFIIPNRANRYNTLLSSGISIIYIIVIYWCCIRTTSNDVLSWVFLGIFYILFLPLWYYYYNQWCEETEEKLLSSEGESSNLYVWFDHQLKSKSLKI